MTINVYTLREIRESRFIEDDSVSIITAHGQPVKITIPFDERAFQEGFEKSLALHLVENQVITQAKAAKIAGLSLSSFLALMAKYHISAADQSRQEVNQELAQFQ